MELVGLQEIAKMLDVLPQTARTWRYRNVLPPPIQDLKMGPVWWKADIERWARETGRLPS